MIGYVRKVSFNSSICILSRLYKLVFLFGLLAVCCSESTQANNTEKTLSLDTGLFLGAFPDIERPDLEIAMRFWVEKISQQYGIPATASIYQNINDLRADFDLGKVNLIIASPLPILNAFDPEMLTNGYKVVVDSTDSTDKDDLLVITNKQSGIRHFKDVKNKQLSLLANDPISDMYIDSLTLTHFSKRTKAVFKNIEYVYKGSQLIYKLFFNKTDVIVVYKPTYELALELNPQIKLQTQVIASLSDIPQALGFFNRHVDPEFREKIISIMLSLHHSAKGKQLLSLFYADKFVRSSLEDLKTTQELKQRYQQLMTKYRLQQ